MPRIAVVSDIHGNLDALNAVINSSDEESPDEWICLGDFVGYGPCPNEVIEIVREKGMHCVLGNHDAGVISKLSLNHFRNPNRKLIEMSKELVSKDNLQWLNSLPLVLKKDNWIAVHASPIEPDKWKYIESAFVAREILKDLPQRICLVGHTHKSALVSDSIAVKKFNSQNKFLINPGSVGQSRDEDYRASYCIIDTDNFEYKNFRIDYETDNLRTKLEKLGFSISESKRLLRM